MKFEVLKKSHVKRNILIGVFIVAIVSAVVLNFTRAKYRVAQSMPLYNATVNYTPYDFKMVAMYQENDRGEYVSIDTVPTSGYTLNENESYCEVDGIRDDTIAMEYYNGMVNIGVSKKGTKCYLYFDKPSIAADVIEGLYEDNQDILAYDDYGNLRYIGANPNNYVLFNDELWRIIGVFSEDTHGMSGQKLVKLIRSESLGNNILWDSSNTNDWSTASLQTALNNDYLNGSGSYTSAGIKNDTTREMIETVTWKLGGWNTSGLTASEFYYYEREAPAYGDNPTEWIGKVALMYPSDYGYATSGGTSSQRKTCLSTYNWSNYCYNNDWIFNSSNQWTLNPIYPTTMIVLTLNSSGELSTINANSMGYNVRPVVYLKSSILISSGNGSNSSPYTLSL